ncbi:hypothetical protein GBA65_03250 [Rubrobacter marinus]|uniref:Uncharacterized protein n=1 Tax=Rubrobacter marinus TaxID=2653852 RepID=A0A6G8PT70_9ACTN|nr:hypothetical protein [Rubrobacter marinus]QIN77689.1 hypothetical protein GBA65_03250 [Rubrobacter marinus]
MLVYLLAPLMLILIPAVLWLSIAPAGASGATPVWLAVPDPVVFEFSALHLASLALIGAVAIGMLTLEAARAPFSLHLAHWVFVYVFFFAAPLVQYKIGAFPWGRLTAFDVETLLLTDLAILVWCAVWICMRALQTRVLPGLPLPLGPGVTASGVWLSVGLALVATVLLVVWLGVGALLTRADDYGASLNTSTVFLLLEKVLRGIPVAASAGALWYLRRGEAPLLVRLGLVAVALGLLLVADFPLGTARYVVGSVYLGLLLTVVGGRLRNGWPFVFLMVGGLLVMFPLLSTLRYVTSPSEIISYVGGFTLLGPSLATGISMRTPRSATPWST